MRPLDAAALAAWLGAFSADVAEHEAELTDLDRRIGDADHGTNMHRGMAAVAALPADGTAAEYAKRAAMTLISTVGGAAGPLYGTFLLRFGTALGEGGDAATLGEALKAGVDGIVARGKAEEGDKTMYDALKPALAAYDEAVAGGADIQTALEAAARASAEGRDATIPLVARKGRASYLGERSAGHQDPGATSVTMLIETAAATLS